MYETLSNAEINKNILSVLSMYVFVRVTVKMLPENQHNELKVINCSPEPRRAAELSQTSLCSSVRVNTFT